MSSEILRLRVVLLAELEPLIGIYSDADEDLYLGYLAGFDEGEHVFVPINLGQVQALAERSTSLWAVAEACAWHLVVVGDVTMDGVSGNAQISRVEGQPQSLPAEPDQRDLFEALK